MHTVTALGADIPALGLGTFQLVGDRGRRAVREALAMGYRHLDTAQMYGNETEVGEGVKGSGVPREQIFVTTKIWPDDFRAGDFQVAVRESLRRLGSDYVDLLLLHWPSPRVPLAETLGALDEVREQGLARHVGVSNFPSELFRRAAAAARSPIVADQVEYHPYLDQGVLLDTLRSAGAALIAYCPLAKGRAAEDPVLREIGHGHGVTAGQVALRWLVQQEGVAAIPRSSRPERLRSNLAVFDFHLSEEEMTRVAALARADGRLVEMEGLAPEWD